MKKLWIVFGIILLISMNSYSQSLGSLRNKLGNAMIDKAIDEEFGNSDEGNSDQSTSTANESSDSPTQNAGGSGLDNSLDDVPNALAQASTDFNAKEYRNARTSLRKALRALEFKIGEDILASLPEEVKGLSVKTDADRVTSSSDRWAGLTIHREYQKNNTWAAVSIYNGTASSLVNSAIYTGAYSSSTEDNENQKEITVKGYDAVITYSESDGYSVCVTLGQQTFVIVEGVNVASESEMRSIAESFDYDKIKKSLGDQ